MRLFFTLILSYGFSIGIIVSQDRPNILVLVADDMGADAFAPYNIGTDLPHTPNLSQLVTNGLLFKNAWSNPTCAPSRSSLLTGRIGSKTGLVRSGPNLDRNELTLFEHIADITNDAYTDALFGKWHLGNANSPNLQGVDHFIGNIHSGVDDYYNWERTINGNTDTLNQYVATYLTDQAIDWIDNQTTPWFLWMAYNAPHGPIHLPPDSLYTRTDTLSDFDKYMCMIESVDHEVGRLMNSLSTTEKENTFIVFVGDNGTPNRTLQSYPNRHGKGSVYEGGIRVPMVVSGFGVDRINEKENALISFTDLFATITELLGEKVQGGIDNSFSFHPLLSQSQGPKRAYNYSEIQDGDLYRAIRNDQYKLILREDSIHGFYDLSIDSLEQNELISLGLTNEQKAILEDLRSEADSIMLSWSCRDGIMNGDEEAIDCGEMTSCGSCTTSDQGIIIENCGISIYPNPTEGAFSLKVAEGNYEVKIIDIHGSIHATYNLLGSYKIDISSLPDGVYFLEVTNLIDSKVYLSKVIKE